MGVREAYESRSLGERAWLSVDSDREHLVVMAQSGIISESPRTEVGLTVGGDDMEAIAIGG